MFIIVLDLLRKRSLLKIIKMRCGIPNVVLCLTDTSLFIYIQVKLDEIRFRR